jgi:AraC-like DNA-binding protein
LTQDDCFIISSGNKNNFDFPFHSHNEFELDLILHAENAKRIIGDHAAPIGDAELVLVGPNLPHGWFTDKCTSPNIHETVIQFHRDLLDNKFLQRRQMSHLRAMFEKSIFGVLFSKETIRRLSPRIMSLTEKTEFESVLELLSILHQLSVSENSTTLSTSSFDRDNAPYGNQRIEKVLQYMHANFNRDINLTEISKVVNMTDVSFSRFFKRKTGQTFVDTLNDIRLTNATRMLLDTSNGIAEIAYQCGFNNISNFNRIFKKRKDCTPKEFRKNISGTKVFV